MKHMFDCDKMESVKRPFITKADILLLTVILTAALMLLFLFRISRAPGDHAVLSHDGRTIMQIPLSQTEPQYYLVLWSAASDDAQTSSKEQISFDGQISLEAPVVKVLAPEVWEEEAEAALTAYGASAYNLFSCENGEIRMMQSSCPDLICVHHAAVSRTGESIICLPHKLVIEIAGTQENELDGVVY